MLSTLQPRGRPATPFFAFHLMGSTRPRFRQSSPAIARRCNAETFQPFNLNIGFNPHRRSLAGATRYLITYFQACINDILYPGITYASVRLCETFLFHMYFHLAYNIDKA